MVSQFTYIFLFYFHIPSFHHRTEELTQFSISFPFPSNSREEEGCSFDKSKFYKNALHMRMYELSKNLEKPQGSGLMHAIKIIIFHNFAFKQ